nr:hypothetical protein [Tanacetum cinerariifolium]
PKTTSLSIPLSTTSFAGVSEPEVLESLPPLLLKLLHCLANGESFPQDLEHVPPAFRLFILAMSMVDRSSSKRASVIKALKKASPKVVGFDLNSSKSCRFLKRAFTARANEKALPKVVGFDLKNKNCRAGLSPDIYKCFK